MRAAAGLQVHAIATVLESEAVLIRPNVIKHPALEPLITNRINGVIAARKYVVCEYNILRVKLADVTVITPGRRAPTVSPLEDEGWIAVSVMVEKKRIADIMDQLVGAGAEDIMVFNLDNCRV
jgi:ATP phosphoribosyltransferase